MAGCTCATFVPDEGRYVCEITECGCMFLIPDSKECAEKYGEGPDAEEDV